MLLNEVGRKKTFIISYKRQFVSEIAFYAEGHPTVHTLNVTGRRNSRYDPWEGFENKIGLNALYSFAKAFEGVEEIRRVMIYAGEELIKGFSIFYCWGFHGLDQGP